MLGGSGGRATHWSGLLGRGAGVRWLVQQGHAFVTASSKAEYDDDDIEGIFEFELTTEEVARLHAVNTTDLMGAPPVL